MAGSVYHKNLAAEQASFNAAWRLIAEAAPALLLRGSYFTFTCVKSLVSSETFLGRGFVHSESLSIETIKTLT